VPGHLLELLARGIHERADRLHVRRVEIDGAFERLARVDVAERMVRGGESFWAVVYPPFIARDLTRGDVRLVVRKGLEEARGNYKLLVALFNMPPTDYKRFLNFLRKHDCHMPFQRFRSAATAIAVDTSAGEPDSPLTDADDDPYRVV
jgi:hypothetical protein